MLATLIVGSLLAPLSHYLFMTFSDAYAPLRQSSHHAGGHHGPASFDDGPSFHSTNTHLVCTYADLFATFVATADDASEPAIATPEQGYYLLEYGIRAVISTFNLSLSRAPPLA